MNEWEFTAEVASRINRILAHDRDLPFSRARCEQRGKGSRKRRDLTLLDRDQRPVLTGEIKLPYRKDGGSPYNASLVGDARQKANRAGARFFFTWNVNEFVLWETSPSKVSWKDQNYKSWEVTSVHQESHLESPPTVHAIGSWLPVFLHAFARILRGTVAIGAKSPDEKFVEVLESSLQMPVLLNCAELHARYRQSRFRSELDKWMREEQGWVIYDDPEGIRDNLESASKFACYALVNKLVFHEALLKRHRENMQKLSVPEHIDTGEGLRQHLQSHFAQAMEVTRDYETVFGEELTTIGNRIPFYSDAAVSHWRALINQIREFDFSKLDYEVIGNIFERLISPEERHKFGQFYTRVEVVDLINSFCIRNGDEKVMDPACGGGTFLVRAYARKREVLPTRTHAELLADLYGVDTSHFASHLSTINLATRDLVDAENYPQIARSDFFDIQVHEAFTTLPKHIRTKGLGEVQRRTVQVPALDAVVGNPPYVRQELIPKSRTKKGDTLQAGTKEYYQDRAKTESQADLSGRSDLHCYFWPHASSFLKDDGYLCFLTSSQWLDVEYGFRLQEWMLRNFEIVAIIESLDEPWFVGARVATAITILRRQKDREKRARNTVRFVQLRQPIREVLAHDGTAAGAIRAADEFRDEILSAKAACADRRLRVRLIPQQQLWEEGLELGRMMDKPGDYCGGKWGVHVRAPDLWFNLLEEHGSRFAALGDIAHIHRGITSGKDCFFFPKDCTAEYLEFYKDTIDLEDSPVVPRKLIESGKVKLVRCGKGYGEIRPIEAKYLEPEVHSLMEIDAVTVGKENCSRQILLVGEKRSKIRDEYVLDYIRWGEKQGYHKGSTCAARASEDREWYDLTGHRRGALFWPMAQQYKHAVPINDENLICNHNLFDVSPKNGDADVLAGILNSSWVVLAKYQYGRPVGVEGNLKTEVVDVKMMLVPDPRQATKKARQRVADAFAELKDRKVLQFLSERRLREMAYGLAGREKELRNLSDECEIDMDDRWVLDDAVLQMLGVKPKQRRRELIFSLHRYLEAFFEWTRQKEEKAIENKKRAKRRGPARPSEIAAQIYQEVIEKEGWLLRRYAYDFLDSSKPFDTYEVPPEGTAQAHVDMLAANGVVFTKGGRAPQILIETRHPAQDELIVLCAKAGVRGFVRVPYKEEECRRVFREFEKFIKRREKRILELIEERTVDEDLQEKIYRALMPLICQPYH